MVTLWHGIYSNSRKRETSKLIIRNKSPEGTRIAKTNFRRTGVEWSQRFRSDEHLRAKEGPCRRPSPRP
jgi:hypothetical protein